MNAEETETLRQDFLHAMQRLAATVCVITCRDRDGGRFGIAATSVTSLSLSPVSIVACINRSCDFYRRFLGGSEFCVNILSEEQSEQSRVFGSGRYRDERFRFGEWIDDPDAPPILADAQANLICEADTTMNYGSHAIVAGLVRQIHVRGKLGPLIYLDRKFLPAGISAARPTTHAQCD